MFVLTMCFVNVRLAGYVLMIPSLTVFVVEYLAMKVPMQKTLFISIGSTWYEQVFWD